MKFGPRALSQFRSHLISPAEIRGREIEDALVTKQKCTFGGGGKDKGSSWHFVFDPIAIYYLQPSMRRKRPRYRTQRIKCKPQSVFFCFSEKVSITASTTPRNKDGAETKKEVLGSILLGTLSLNQPTNVKGDKKGRKHIPR